MRDSWSIATALEVGPRPKRLRSPQGVALTALAGLLLGVGEVAEVDTRVPHLFGSTGEQPAEVLSLFGRHGARMHVRARSGQTSSG